MTKRQIERLLLKAKKELKGLQDNLHNATLSNNKQSIEDNTKQIHFAEGKIYTLEEIIELMDEE